jgi:hypothetical protein
VVRILVYTRYYSIPIGQQTILAGSTGGPSFASDGPSRASGIPSLAYGSPSLSSGGPLYASGCFLLAFGVFRLRFFGPVKLDYLPAAGRETLLQHKCRGQ